MKGGRKMNTQVRWISAVVLGGFVLLTLLTAGLREVHGQAASVSWAFVLSAGNQTGSIATACANDGSCITLTGSGTFVAPTGGEGTSSAATGGGAWSLFAPGATTPSATGTYSVTGLVRWEQKGTFPLLPDNAVGGLAILRVEFSDGSQGVLTVSCHAASGADPAVFEGITVSKGHVDYWNRQAPGPEVVGNRTIFHTLSTED